MKIELKEITIRELAEGYKDSVEEGVVAYGGKLDVRPPYQREFVYKEQQRNAVINTIRKGFPLNVMYWAVREDGTYEIIDGQQRTISIYQYIDKVYAVKYGDDTLYFQNLKDTQQQQILDYKLMVNFCSGTDVERLEWFLTINIAGECLTEQELRNAVYSGTWVTDAKKFFSKSNCAAYGLGSKLVAGSPIKQDFLETAIDWISDGKINDYMGRHQNNTNSNELREHYTKVIKWASQTFHKYRKEMKGINWGTLYRLYNNNAYDAAELEKEVSRLMADSDVQKKSGIYAYVFDYDEHHLQIRTFDDNTKREVYERQKGICPICHKPFKIEEMEADHIGPWSKGGRTISDNCQMLCRKCNREKSKK